MYRLNDTCFLSDDEQIAMVYCTIEDVDYYAWVVVNRYGRVLYGPDRDGSAAMLYMTMMEYPSEYP